jgi:hypothetical protein
MVCSCGGSGGREVQYPGGGESALRCEACRGTGRLRCGRCLGTGQTAAPRRLPDELARPVRWQASAKKGQAPPDDLWNAGPFYEYEAMVDGKLWELQQVGDVAPFWRLLVDGVLIGDFESSDWPENWQR